MRCYGRSHIQVWILSPAFGYPPVRRGGRSYWGDLSSEAGQDLLLLMSEPQRPGALVLSLDFELHWGLRDHTPADAPSLRGARATVRRLLATFAEREVACTWATVGLLCAQTREMQEAAAPVVRPVYQDARLDPYKETVGANEEADPVHFGAALVEAIRATTRQELATHTFSHFYCGEPGATVEAFRADLEAARYITPEPPRSIVFPRNQCGEAFLDILPEVGIDVYRGNPLGTLWRVEVGETGRQPHRRLLRLADAYLPFEGDTSVGWEEIPHPSGLANVRASQFLRPYVPRLRALEDLRIRRITRGVEAAARQGRIYHLWWHPHNFGTYPDENFAVLSRILDAFERCRELYGMDSLTMADAADRARKYTGASNKR